MALAVPHVGGNPDTSFSGGVTSDSWTSTSGSLIVAIGWTYDTTQAFANNMITDSKGNAFPLLSSSGGGSNLLGVGIWYNNAGTRGASHTVSTGGWTGGVAAGNCLAVIEITGFDTGTPFDAATDAFATDATSPYAVTAAAAISGNQVAVYGCTLDIGDNNAWTNPGGYTPINSWANGSADIVHASSYKINETGTPSPAASRTGTAGAAIELFLTVKEAGGAAPTGTVAVTLAAVTSAVSGTVVITDPYVVTSNGAAIAANDLSVTFTGYTPALDDVVALFGSSTTVLGVVANASLPAGWVNPLGDGVEILSDAHGMCVLWHKVTQGEVDAVTTTYTATDVLDATETGYCQGVVIRNVDPDNVIDSSNTAQDSANTVTPHVLAGLTGTNLSNSSLVVSSVAKDGTGDYGTGAVTGWTRLRNDNTNQGRWLGYLTALTTANSDVAATNITPSAGDEYVSITLAFTKKLVSAPTGTVAVTLAAVTSTTDGLVHPTGTVAGTFAAVTSTISGVVANPVTGTVSRTLAAVMSTVAGGETFTGTVSRTFADLTSTVSGTIANPVTGTVAVTLAALTSAIDGTASGAAPVTGTVSRTLAAVTSTIAGTEVVTGTVSATLAAVTSTITGTVANPITGTVSRTLAALTSTVIGAKGSFAHSITSRRVLDHAGKAWAMKCSSSWTLAQRLSNANITTYLEGLATLGFNAVTVSPCGNNYGGDNPYQNLATDPFFTGSPFASTLGSAWASMDWVVTEAARLEITVLLSIYTGFGTQGIEADLIAAGTTEARTFGQRLAARYATAYNIMWHIGADKSYTPASSTGQVVDAVFHGIDETEAPGYRLRTAEPDQNAYLSGATQFFDNSYTYVIPAGQTASNLAVDSYYSYDLARADRADEVYTVDTTYSLWDCEPLYWIHTTDGQQFREQPYAAFFRGGVGINVGDEDLWRFGLTGVYDGGRTWQQALADSPYAWMGYVWDLIDVVAWATTTPSAVNTLITSGEQTGDNRASACYSANLGLIYLPTSRSVTLDLTLFNSHTAALVRKMDPTTGTITTVGTYSTAGTQVIGALGNNASGTSADWVLVIDGVEAITGTVSRTLAAVTSTITGVEHPSGTVAVTLAALTSTVAGTELFTGTVARTLAAVTSTISGTSVAGVTGTVAVTFAAVTSTIVGLEQPSGTVARTLDPLTPTITGAETITGTVARTLAAVTSTISGTHTLAGITGSVAQTLAAVTPTIAGQHTIPAVTGTVAVTLAAVTASIAEILIHLNVARRYDIDVRTVTDVDARSVNDKDGWTVRIIP